MHHAVAALRAWSECARYAAARLPRRGKRLAEAGMEHGLGRPHVEAAKAAAGTREGRHRRAAAVVRRAFLIVAEDLRRRRDGHKLGLRRLSVAGILVRVPPKRQSAVCALYLAGGGAARHAEDVVVIRHGRAEGEPKACLLCELWPLQLLGVNNGSRGVCVCVCVCVCGALRPYFRWGLLGGDVLWVDRGWTQFGMRKCENTW